MAQFDAELDTDKCDPYNNAELTLTLRLGFRQIDPAGGANEGVYNDYGDPTKPTRKIRKWTAASWASWKQNFISTAQKYWHGKFWLINNFADYEFVKKGVTYRPNIWCRFILEGSDANLGVHHHKIDVVRLHPDENWFGSHSTLYDSLDTKSVQKGTDSASKPIMQQAHVHEVGHLLGLGHVDIGKPHCLPGGNTNAASCYGVADFDKYSVMGQGMQLRDQHANPWRTAMIAISGDGSLSTPGDWTPKMQRHYPRTADEVVRKISVTKYPNRG